MPNTIREGCDVNTTASPSAWTGPAPDDITAWLLVQVGHVVGRRFVAALGEVELTPTQFGVLLQLHLNPGMSNGEIARSVLVTPQTMSELQASLVGLGLIERDPPAGRGHRVPARITAEGRTTLRRCADAVATVEASLGFTPEDAAQLNHLLHHILQPGGPARHLS